MAFKWHNYLDVANHLMTCRENEACQDAMNRSAVSRAYFAAFGEACSYASDHFGFQKTFLPNDHRELKTLFREKKRMAIATKLDELRLWRNKCDYEDEVPNSEFIARNALTVAKSLIAELR